MKLNRQERFRERQRLASRPSIEEQRDRLNSLPKFALPYDIGLRRFGEEAVEMSVEDAQLLVDLFHTNFPKFREFSHNMVFDQFGRIRRIKLQIGPSFSYIRPVENQILSEDLLNDMADNSLDFWFRENEQLYAYLAVGMRIHWVIAHEGAD